MIPIYIQAGLWGIIGSFALIIGSIIGCYLNVPKKIIGAMNAFSAGILSSAVCFELIYESYSYGGFLYTISGFIVGVIIFTVIDYLLNHLNKKFYKTRITNPDYQPFEYNAKNSLNMKSPLTEDFKIVESKYKKIKNKAIKFYQHKYSKPFNKYQIESLVTVTGALLDGIPESIAIGLILIIGGPISISMLIAVFVANTFEGISSSKNMKLGGWKIKFILSVWIIVTIITGLSAMLGYIIFSNTDHHIYSFALAMAAGALLAVIADVLLPESFDKTREFTGVLMALGFLFSFVLSHL